MDSFLSDIIITGSSFESCLASDLWRSWPFLEFLTKRQLRVRNGINSTGEEQHIWFHGRAKIFELPHIRAYCLNVYHTSFNTVMFPQDSFHMADSSIFSWHCSSSLISTGQGISFEKNPHNLKNNCGAISSSSCHVLIWLVSVWCQIGSQDRRNLSASYKMIWHGGPHYM